MTDTAKKTTEKKKSPSTHSHAKKRTAGKSSSSVKKNSGKKKAPAKKKAPKKLTQKERQRQLQFRAGLSVLAAALLIFLFFRHHRSASRPNGQAVNLTDSVVQYQKQVEHYCEEYDIPAFSQVVLAIMQQESAGTVPDVMQASESPFNTWYPNSPGSIDDPDYSIRVGVETFAYCLNEAGCTSPSDTAHLKLALQSYNYGNSYAAWALNNYGEYSPDNAQEFSENMKVRLGWAHYGDPEYVDHVLRYYQFGS